MLLWWSLMQWLGSAVVPLTAADACNTFYVLIEAGLTVGADPATLGVGGDVNLQVGADPSNLSVTGCGL